MQVSIDDFGTGYSSLSYLSRLPVDKLKIDQSFIRNLPDDPDAAAVAKAIIDLGHCSGDEGDRRGRRDEGADGLPPREWLRRRPGVLLRPTRCPPTLPLARLDPTRRRSPQKRPSPRSITEEPEPRSSIQNCRIKRTNV